MAVTIYCDESGFTGNNLADDGSPYFTFASVALEPDLAERLIREIKTEFRLQGEIKGANLTKHAEGRKAVTKLLQLIAPSTKVVAGDKKYALAGKLFEYIFEPTISDNNRLFYDIGFHEFIANLLYMELRVQPESTGELLTSFQNAMRNLKSEQLMTMLRLTNSVEEGDGSPSAHVLRFATLQKHAILQEMDSLGTNSTGRWVLDLSATSLDSVLAAWGESMDKMQVICDDSKPLKDLQRLFLPRIKELPKKYIEIRGRRRLLTYSLAGPIQFGKSKEFPGLQLADIVASSFAFALSNRADENAKDWLRILLTGGAVHDCILPDLEQVDLVNPQAMLNNLVLLELLRRAEKNVALLDGMPEFLKRVTRDMDNIMRNLQD